MTSTLTLTFNHDTFRLDVKGEAPALDVFLAMLAQAQREFEAQLRAQKALQLQAQINEHRTNEMIRAKIAGKA